MRRRCTQMLGRLVDCRQVNVTRADRVQTDVISDAIVLSEAEKVELSRITQSRSVPAGYVFRARLILMLAEDVSYSLIKLRLKSKAPTISRWKQRFLTEGLDGLDTSHPGQRPSVLTPRLRARILAATRKPPTDGLTHWSCRKLAAALNVTKDTVHRVWQEAGLKPHRLERYMASNDPDCEAKAADIIGLYLNPPQHAAVFCIDEKTAIQALERLDPVLPLSPGRIERHGFEYHRHGTLSLYAAEETATGRVHGKATARHTSQDFVGFLKEVVAYCPGSRFTSFLITCPRTKPASSISSSSKTRASSSTSPRRILPGSTRSSFGSERSNATLLPVASSPRYLTWPAKSNARSRLTRPTPSPFSGSTQIPNAASVVVTNSLRQATSKNSTHLPRMLCATMSRDLTNWFPVPMKSST